MVGQAALRILAFALAAAAPSAFSGAFAQSATPSDPFTGTEIERVDIRLANPSPDTALNDRVTDSVRRRVSIFPGSRYSADRTNFALSQARRVPDVAALTHDIGFGTRGGVVVTITVTLTDTAATGDARGGLTKGAGFPVLYDRDGTYIRAKVEAMALYYSNNNAWFGRPDLMLQGNPLVQGNPAGRGYEDWVEGYIHTGLSGITPLSDTLYVYAAGSVMAVVGGRGQARPSAPA